MNGILFFTLFSFSFCITIQNSVTFTSNIEKNFDTNYISLTPKGFGFYYGGNFTLDVTLSDNANQSNMLLLVYDYDPWLVYYTAGYHEIYGENWLCNYPSYYRVPLRSGRTVISKTVYVTKLYSILLLKCQPGNNYGDVTATYSLKLANPNGQELSFIEAPLTNGYLFYMITYTILLVIWIVVNVFNLLHISFLKQVPLTLAFLLKILHMVFCFLYFYHYSNDGYELFWTKFLRSIFETISDTYILVCILFVCIAWRMFKITRRMFFTILSICLLFLLFAFGKAVWVIPDTGTNILEGLFWVFKLFMQFVIAVSILKTRSSLQRFGQHRNVKHETIYHHYKSLGMFFWLFAVYISIPIGLALIQFSLLSWSQYYMYELLIEGNNALLYCFIIYSFRPVSYKNYKSALNSNKKKS